MTAAQNTTVNNRLSQPWFQLKSGGHSQEFNGGNPRLQGPAIALDARDTQNTGVSVSLSPALPFSNCFIFPFPCWPYRNRLVTAM